MNANPRAARPALLLTTTLPPRIGGMENYYGEIARRVPSGTLLASAPLTPGWREADPEFPVEIRRPPIPHEEAGRFVWVVVWWIWTLATVLRRNVTLLHCGNVKPTGYLGLWTKRLTGRPYSLFFHGMDVEKAIVRLARGGPRARSLRRILDGADLVFANSRDTVARLERAGVNPARVRLLHPGVDVERFRPADEASSPSAPVLVTVGRYAERKGVGRVIRLLPRLCERHPGLTLRIAGRRQEENLARLAADVGAADAVRFLGEIDDRELPTLYRSADLFVMPSWEDEQTSSVEGFGIVYLEAAACGVPSIGGRTGGVADAIEDGVTGLLADPGDEEDLFRKIDRLLTDRDERREMGRRARERAEREFTWDRAAEILHRETEAVLATRAAR